MLFKIKFRGNSSRCFPTTLEIDALCMLTLSQAKDKHNEHAHEGNRGVRGIVRCRAFCSREIAIISSIEDDWAMVLREGRREEL